MSMPPSIGPADTHSKQTMVHNSSLQEKAIDAVFFLITKKKKTKKHKVDRSVKKKRHVDPRKPSKKKPQGNVKRQKQPQVEKNATDPQRRRLHDDQGRISDPPAKKTPNDFLYGNYDISSRSRNNYIRHNETKTAHVYYPQYEDEYKRDLLAQVRDQRHTQEYGEQYPQDYYHHQQQNDFDDYPYKQYYDEYPQKHYHSSFDQQQMPDYHKPQVSSMELDHRFQELQRLDQTTFGLPERIIESNAVDVHQRASKMLDSFTKRIPEQKLHKKAHRAGSTIPNHPVTKTRKKQRPIHIGTIGPRQSSMDAEKKTPQGKHLRISQPTQRSDSRTRKKHEREVPVDTVVSRKPSMATDKKTLQKTRKKKEKVPIVVTAPRTPIGADKKVLERKYQLAEAPQLFSDSFSSSPSSSESSSDSISSESSSTSSSSSSSSSSESESSSSKSTMPENKNKKQEIAKPALEETPTTPRAPKKSAQSSPLDPQNNALEKRGDSGKGEETPTTPRAPKKSVQSSPLDPQNNALEKRDDSGKGIHDLASPRQARKMGDYLQGKDVSYRDSAVSILKDETIKKEVESLVEQIESVNGFPKTRRPSLRDNPLISDVKRVIQNDPELTEIVVDHDMRSFGTISKKMLRDFLDALRINLHLKSITMKGLELRNDLLHELASAMESNFVIEKLDLSDNCFTNEGLASFCQSLASSNDTCLQVNLKNQRTSVSTASQEDVLEAFRQSKTLTDVQLDFQSNDGTELLEKIMKRNRAELPPAVDRESKLLSVLQNELKRASEFVDESDYTDLVAPENDWDRLYELAGLFSKHKLKEETPADPGESKPKLTEADIPTEAKKKSEFLFGKFKDILEEQAVCFNTDGSFLTDEFIAKYFVENSEKEELIFDFHGQWKLFKRFPVHDPDRGRIVAKFVDAIVSHPRVKEITGINMAAVGCGDDFLIELAHRCLQDTSLLPNIQMVNFETNYINETGIVALSKLIASPDAWRYLQVVRLENQYDMLKTKAESALARAMWVNRSVVVMSLQVRNLLERQRISDSIVRNVDLLREARQKYNKATGKNRERNEMEIFFDKIAANDPSIKEVEVAGNHRFLSLSKEERLKAASSFAANSHVISINFSFCSIDDAFAEALALAFEDNSTIEEIFLEDNAISGVGIKALFQGLAKNNSIRELTLYNQSKTVTSSDEEFLADLLEPNKTILKLGIGLRSQMALIKLDQKLRYNRNLLLKKRNSANEANGGEPKA